MSSLQLWSCIALTLALVSSSTPTPSSAEETQQQVQQVLLDLQLLLKGVNNCKSPILSRMLTFKFYMPKKATELKHLQCLEEELGPLQEVLKLAQSKNIHLKNSRDIISNIKVTVLKLKGSETLLCEYNDETVTIVEFLSRWITFCQGIMSRLT